MNIKIKLSVLSAVFIFMSLIYPTKNVFSNKDISYETLASNMANKTQTVREIYSHEDITKKDISDISQEIIPKTYMAILYEKIKGEYKAYSIGDIYGKVVFYINTKNNKIYVQYDIFTNKSGIYELPSHNLIVDPDFEIEDYEEYNNYDKFVYSILLNKKLIDSKTILDLKYKKQGNMLKINAKNKKTSNFIGKYTIELKNKKFVDDKSKKVLYQSKKIKYPRKNINEKNAGKEVIEILKKLNKLDNDKKIYVTDVKKFKDENYEYVKDGYLVFLRCDNEIDENLSESLGIYVINEDGTSLMIYDVVLDFYYKIYGNL